MVRTLLVRCAPIHTLDFPPGLFYNLFFPLTNTVLCVLYSRYASHVYNDSFVFFSFLSSPLSSSSEVGGAS